MNNKLLRGCLGFLIACGIHANADPIIDEFAGDCFYVFNTPDCLVGYSGGSKLVDRYACQNEVDKYLARLAAWQSCVTETAQRRAAQAAEAADSLYAEIKRSSLKKLDCLYSETALFCD